MDHWWLIMIGVTMLATMLVCGLLGSREPRTGCPECGHEAGLNGKHCSDADHDNGWSGHLCKCQNDYHWNYESVGLEA